MKSRLQPDAVETAVPSASALSSITSITSPGEVKMFPVPKEVSHKDLHNAEDECFEVSVCSMKGFREAMEDSFSTLLKMPKHSDAAFFGVFDGHGGRSSSKWTAKHLPEYLDDLENFSQDNITNACLTADKDLLQEVSKSGCTAVFALLEKNLKRGDSNKKMKADDESSGQNVEGTETLIERKRSENDLTWTLTVGNIGDSRCILLREGGKSHMFLTQDHKPTIPEEKKRIEEAGGFVKGKRVDGVLAMSRAMGDGNLKDEPNLALDEQKVIAVPDVTVVPDVKGGDYILLFCDGIVERKISNIDVAQFVYEQIQQGINAGVILQNLFNEALKSGSGDNMTAILVKCKSITIDQVINPTTTSSSSSSSTEATFVSEIREENEGNNKKRKLPDA